MINNRISEEEKEIRYQDQLASYPEVWKRIRINGELSKYSVSNHGRVRNLNTGYIMESVKYDNPRCYKQVTLFHNGKEFKISLHRLIAMYFCTIPKRHRENGKTFEDLVPNHKDGVRHHNAAFNLEWITQYENMDHAWKTGLCDGTRGENSHLAIIGEKEAIQICEYIMQKKSNKEIAALMPDVSEKTIQHIRSGECWKHISCKYDFPKIGKAVPFTVSTNTMHEICKMLEEKKYTDRAIGEQFGLSREYIRDIRNHKRRTDISSQYNF